jgi:predicted phosphoribosyltransferase
MGRVLADELGGELDVVLVRKLRSPDSPEFAVGAIDESGWAYIAGHAASAGADEAYLEREKRAQLETLRKRRAQQPERLMCAVPVAAPDSLERVRPYAEETVCLEAQEFFAVAQFYRQFPQVEDEDVVALLAHDAKAAGASVR